MKGAKGFPRVCTVVGLYSCCPDLAAVSKVEEDALTVAEVPRLDRLAC